jgi:hypothetical protein
MQEPFKSFNHAAMKIEWARRSIQQFQLAATAWIEHCSSPVQLGENLGGVGYSLVVGVEMPPWVPLWAGDICNNLRSSLDFAWMGLVRAANPGSNDKKTLPITDNRKGLLATINKAPIGDALERATILLADNIRPHKDFADGGNVNIVELNDLSNWNKHNLLLAGYAVTELKNVKIGNIQIGTLRNGGRGVVIDFAGLSKSPELIYEGKPKIDIIFAQGGAIRGGPILTALANFHDSCLEALNAFRDAFPAPDPGDLVG